MPSGGLVDDPEEQKFYDWLLKDAKDRPFATFKFQYRSWEYLASLQIISEDQPRVLLPPTPSLLDLNGVAKQIADFDTESSIEGASQYDVISPTNHHDDDSISSDGSATPWNTGVFDPEPEPTKKLPPGIQPSYIIPPRTSSMAADTHKAEDIWAEMKQRPLPPIPDDDSPRAHSRSSSGTGVSIATSLQSYANRSLSGSPEPEIGIAVAMPIAPIRRSVSRRSIHLVDNTGSPTRTGSPDPTGSPRQHMMAVARNRPSSPVAVPQIADMANVTVRKPRRTTPKRNGSSSPFNQQSDNMDISQLTADTTALTLNESEWMNSIPSPTRKGREQTKIEEMWGPNYEGAIEHGDRLRQKSLEWYEKTQARAAAHNGVHVKDENDEKNIMEGNWI